MASSAAAEELSAAAAAQPAVYDPPLEVLPAQLAEELQCVLERYYQAEEESTSHPQRLDQVIGAPVMAKATSANYMDVLVPIEETDWHFVEATPGAPPPALGDFPPVPADVPVVPMSPDARCATADSYEEHDATDVSPLGVPGDPTV